MGIIGKSLLATISAVVFLACLVWFSNLWANIHIGANEAKIILPALFGAAALYGLFYACFTPLEKE